MKDSWGPLKALAVATLINGIGDVVLCSFLGYGIAGAAWATMASQVCSRKLFMLCLPLLISNFFYSCKFIEYTFLICICNLLECVRLLQLI